MPDKPKRNKEEKVRKALARGLADKGVELLTEIEIGLKEKITPAEMKKKVKETVSTWGDDLFYVIHKPL